MEQSLTELIQKRARHRSRSDESLKSSGGAHVSARACRRPDPVHAQRRRIRPVSLPGWRAAGGWELKPPCIRDRFCTASPRPLARARPRSTHTSVIRSASPTSARTSAAGRGSPAQVDRFRHRSRAAVRHRDVVPPDACACSRAGAEVTVAAAHRRDSATTLRNDGAADPAVGHAVGIAADGPMPGRRVTQASRSTSVSSRFAAASPRRPRSSSRSSSIHDDAIAGD